ncbi:MAG: UDP-N-acetylmuramate dehydrogenase [Oligoflexia bacterium]|nr:UDP-N-acetylmuramate dehydrogenase [Oligoflexia bacterium]
MGMNENVKLGARTSLLVGGEARYFAEPTSMSELKEAQQWALTNGFPITVLGGGTNVLISDKGISGLVISLSKLSGIEIVHESPELQFWAWSGTAKSELLKIFLKYKLQPAEFLAGLPGQVGGGVVMNAGVSENLRPREFNEITKAVEVLRPNGIVEQLSGSRLQWAYRHCHGWQPGIITRVLISWPNQPDGKIRERVKDLNQKRLHKQPLEWPSCGSVFRNPLPQTAGQLIESAGLKGFQIGGAQVSEKHANFIINKGGAKASDIQALMIHCQKRVKEVHGVDLQSEVVFLGDF